MTEPSRSALETWPDPHPLGHTTIEVGRIGLGLREIGRDPERSRRLIERAVEVGIRYFDVAPSYGRGIAEERLGAALADLGRDRFVVSTKAGQLIRPQTGRQRAIHTINETLTGGGPGLRMAAGRARRALAIGSRVLAGPGSGPAPAGPAKAPEVAPGTYVTSVRAPAMVPICDYSYDGALRSVEESLRRLRTDRVEVVYLHDPDIHRRQAMRGAYRALDGLRRAGAIGAVGASLNDGRTLARFADEGDFDVFLLAGRYTLLDQSGAATLFPVTTARGIGLVVAGVFNGGLLADPAAFKTYNWSPAPAETRRRAIRIAEVCRRHGVDLKAAALQFSFANPAASTLLLGATSAEELDECLALLRVPIPAELWADLTSGGFLRPGLPTPAGSLTTGRPDWTTLGRRAVPARTGALVRPGRDDLSLGLTWAARPTDPTCRSPDPRSPTPSARPSSRCSTRAG